jgi:hypothetical protein
MERRSATRAALGSKPQQAVTEPPRCSCSKSVRPPREVHFVSLTRTRKPILPDKPGPASRVGRWWTGEDSNLRSPQGAADLQSAGFSHSPTRPARSSRGYKLPVRRTVRTQRSSSANPTRTEPDCYTGYAAMQKRLVSEDTSPSAFVARNPSLSLAPKSSRSSKSAGGGN